MINRERGVGLRQEEGEVGVLGHGFAQAEAGDAEAAVDERRELPPEHEDVGFGHVDHEGLLGIAESVPSAAGGAGI